MTKTFMLTIPRSVHKRILKILISKTDCKKWVIGKETGMNGYEHWQVRVQTSAKNFFEICKGMIPEAHIEEATDNWEYERKGGNFWCSDDTNEIRKCRFGVCNQIQQKFRKAIATQGVRTVDVFYDPIGNKGKTFFTI